MTETATSHSAPQARRLERSRSDRKVAGVAGGLARYFDLDPVIYRVAFIVLTLLGGSGLLLYVAAVFVIPDEGKEDSIAGGIIRDRRDRPWAVIGLGLLALAGLAFLSSVDFWPNDDGAWICFAVLGAIILWVQRRGDAGKRSWLRITLGVLTALVVAAVAAATVAAFSVGHVTDGVGERVYHVTSTDTLAPRYKLGIGRLDLDLTNVDLPAGTTRLALKLGVGELHVAAPAGTIVRYHADVHGGNIAVSDVEHDGWRIARDGILGDGAASGAPVLEIDADIGFGEFRLDRTP
jgi:phage shock protein PspC (stress-responsive transcriptional regulator)